MAASVMVSPQFVNDAGVPVTFAMSISETIGCGRELPPEALLGPRIRSVQCNHRFDHPGFGF
jgi:hypothetical protein